MASRGEFLKKWSLQPPSIQICLAISYIVVWGYSSLVPPLGLAVETLLFSLLLIGYLYCISVRWHPNFGCVTTRG